MSRLEDDEDLPPDDLEQAVRRLREAAERASRVVYIREHGPPQSAVWQPGDTPLTALRNAVNGSIHATIAGVTDWFTIDSVSSPAQDGEVVIGFWRPMETG